MSKKIKKDAKKKGLPQGDHTMKSIREDRASLIYFLSLLFVFGLTYYNIFDTKIDLNGDNANYYVLGKALANGKGYVNINNIEENPNNHFPPGYPAIISLVLLVFGDNLIAIKVFNGIFFITGLLVLFNLLKKFISGNAIPFITTIFIAINAHYLRYSTIMMTEIPFFLFTLLFFLFFIKLDSSPDFLRSRNFYLSLLMLVIAYYIKSTGIAILGAVILYSLIQKRWKLALAYLGAFIIFFLPWFIRSQQLGGSSYVRQLMMVNPYRPELGKADAIEFFVRIFRNISRYITREIPDSLFPFVDVNYQAKTSFTEWLLGLIVVGFIIYGLTKVPRYKWLLISYLLGNFAILFLWPDVWIGIRFIMPIVPFLLFCLILGVHASIGYLLAQINIKRNLNPHYYLLAAFLFFPEVQELSLNAKRDYTQNWKNYFAMAEWVDKNRPPEVVVACRKPVLFYLVSNCYTTNYMYTPNHQELLENLKEKKVDLVVLDQLGYRQTYAYLLPAIQNNEDQFKALIQLPNPDTYLLEFMPR